MALYRERIENAVKPLLARGYVIAKVVERPRNFGNTQILLTSEKLGLRFTSDRGQLFVDVSAPRASDWYDLREMLVLSGLSTRSGPWEAADVAVREIEGHETEIMALLGDHNTTAKLLARR